MARRSPLVFSTLAAALMLCAGASFAAPMSDADFKATLEQYDARMMEVRKSGGKLDDALAIQREFGAKFDVPDMTIAQLRELNARALITTYKPGGEDDHSKEALAALDTKITGSGPEAVGALVLKASLLARAAQGDEKPDEADAPKNTIAETLDAALSHPAFGQAVRDGQTDSLWYTVAYEVPKERLVEMAESMRRASAAFPSDAKLGAISGLVPLYDAANATDNATLKDAVETLRVKAVASLKKIVDGDDESVKRGAMRELESLEAAPRIAKLVGSPAPEIDFTWSSNGESLKRLADLRGKVVILDFWATWCGPCVASFPHVRELAKHYEGYPVEIIGVTSPQGATYFEGGVEKAENPEQEFEQMPRFMKERDMTWTVAFSTQEVFNPDYGVRGIPHVVIIDPDGKIVHRALHPASSLAKKAALIDPILEQFGMDHPPAPPAEPEAAPAKE